MTDTPAVLSLPFGLVLKCFFIFPATDSWCSFSHRPSSCTKERRRGSRFTLCLLIFFLWKQSKWTDLLKLYLQWPRGAPAPGGLCIFYPPPPPAWIESAPTAKEQRAVIFFTLALALSYVKWIFCSVWFHQIHRRYLPWLFLKHCPSMVEEILAVPLVSDQKALLDPRCSCKKKQPQNNKLTEWVYIYKSTCNSAILQPTSRGFCKTQFQEMHWSRGRAGLAVNLPSKGWETTQEDVGDDSSCPDVNLKTVPAQRQGG